MTKIQYPYSYLAYGLGIRSQIPVTGFAVSDLETVDVTIKLGEVPMELPGAVSKGVIFDIGLQGYLLRIERVARFLVTGGNHITVQPTGKAAPGEVSAFITGASFGALLQQRRMLPLHASTLEFKGRGIVIAGMSGAGKSTLAAALLAAGATLVADDISVVDFSGDKPAVRPAFPALKIWADALKHLGLPEEGLEPVREELRKYYFPVERFASTPVEISEICILGSHNKEDIERRLLTGIEKFQVLKRNTYFFRGLLKTGLEQNHFTLVNKLANALPVVQLIRPNVGYSTARLVNLLTHV